MCVWSGVKRAVYLKSMVELHKERTDWHESMATARQMFEEAGVAVDLIDGELGVSIRFNGVETKV